MNGPQWHFSVKLSVLLLFRHPSPSVLIPALRTVGNIVTGDDMQTQVLSCGMCHGCFVIYSNFLFSCGVICSLNALICNLFYVYYLFFCHLVCVVAVG